MLIYGRMILTSSGLMLDEVRSLLQKSLRRKDYDLVTKATKELIGRGKDQLPWKSIVTFMFEDHCLNGEDVLLELIRQHKNRNKYGSIELIMLCSTCRVAACLPIIGMDDDYQPVDWNCNIKVEESIQALITRNNSRIDFDILLQHLKEAWEKKHTTHLIAYIKLVTMVNDHDDRTLTEKGRRYCYYGDQTKKPNPGMVALTMLSKVSREQGNQAMERYCRYCCYLATIADVPVRLIVSAAVAQFIHYNDVKHRKDIQLGKIKWGEVGKLDYMPEWATDKHTFRGNCGRGTRHLLKKKPEAKDLSETELEEFHGQRPQRDIGHFFEEGVKCVNEVLTMNPYWERCKELYLQRPKRLQKTIRMTAVYYKDLIHKYPGLKGIKRVCTTDITPSCTETNDSKKRKRDTSDAGSDSEESYHLTKKRLKTSKQTDTVCTSSPNKATKGGTVCTIQEIQSQEEPCTTGPLLQLPTGSAKMYTRVDLDQECVWKGPYKSDRASLAMFFHRALSQVLHDPHTLKVQRKGNYIRFPLVKDANADMEVTEKDFYDCIGKQQVENGKFVKRENLGIIQLHNLDDASFKKIPGSFWCHFMFRYILNIGDSGLYNSITNRAMSFLYGIDMEEIRKNVMGYDILNLMFVKLPKKQLHGAILSSLRDNKPEVLKILTKQYDTKELEGLAKFYKAKFSTIEFEDRMRKVLNALNKL